MIKIFLILFSILILIAIVNAEIIEMDCEASGDASGIYVGPFSQNCESGEGGYGTITCTADTSECDTANINFSYSWAVEKYMTTYDVCDISSTIGTSSFSERVNNRYNQTLNNSDCFGMFEGSNSKNISGTGETATVTIFFSTRDSHMGSAVGCGFTTTPKVNCTKKPDLSIFSVKPIQVIEDANADGDGKIDLVENKPLMVRVDVFLYEATTIPADVKLEIIDDSTKIVEWSETKTGVTIKESYTREERKEGKDTVNFFPGKEWLPVRGKNYIFNATVDLEDKIEESVENNNNKIQLAKVGYNKEKLVIYPVIYRIISPQIIDFSREEGISLINENIEFLKQVYPYDPNYVKSAPIYSITKRDDQTDYYNEKNQRTARKEIVGAIRKMVKNAEKKYPNSKIFAIVIAPSGIIEGGLNYPSVALVQGNRKNEATLSHEYGHELGLYLAGSTMPWDPFEQYEQYKEFGRLSYNGWCLNQYDGSSCGARVNIFISPENLPGGVKFPTEAEWEIKTNEKLKGKFRYFDIMGNALSGRTWMYRPTYHHLLNELVNFD